MNRSKRSFMKTTRPLQTWFGYALFLFLLTLAQAPMRAANSSPPDRMTYQGFLVDANGTALGTDAPKNYDVIFKIYDSQSGGNLEWAEFQTVSVTKGYF